MDASTRLDIIRGKLRFSHKDITVSEWIELINEACLQVFPHLGNLSGFSSISQLINCSTTSWTKRITNPKLCTFEPQESLSLNTHVTFLYGYKHVKKLGGDHLEIHTRDIWLSRKGEWIDWQAYYDMPDGNEYALSSNFRIIPKEGLRDFLEKTLLPESERAPLFILEQLGRLLSSTIEEKKVLIRVLEEKERYLSQILFRII